MAKQRRQMYSLQEIQGPFFQMPTDYDKLVGVYRTLAKSADQRLVRLEKAAELDNFKNATQWAYRRAQRDIKQYSGEDATRFNTKPPESYAELRAKIEDIKTFLESPTSTKSGIKKIHQKRANTINEKFGTDFSWDEIGKFFESELAKKMDKMMASRTMLKVVATLQKNKKQVIEDIEKANKTDVRVPDKIVSKMVNKTIKEYGKEVEELLQSGMKGSKKAK